MADVVSIIAWIVLAAVVLALIVYIAAKVVERRNPPLGNFVEVDGTTLHYVERGSGSPVLFLHGNATMLQDFVLTDAFAAAAGRHRALVFDRPGFGYSTRPGTRSWTAAEQADVFAEALRRLNCNQAVIVQPSFGRGVCGHRCDASAGGCSALHINSCARTNNAATDSSRNIWPLRCARAV